MRKNYRKKTWTGKLYQDKDGRTGVHNYAGHATRFGIGLHVELIEEPDRPVTIAIGPEDIPALKDLIARYEAMQ